MSLKHGTMQNGRWLVWLSPLRSSLPLLLKQKGPKLILAAPLVNQRNYFVLLFFPDFFPQLFRKSWTKGNNLDENWVLPLQKTLVEFLPFLHPVKTQWDVLYICSRFFHLSYDLTFWIFIKVMYSEIFLCHSLPCILNRDTTFFCSLLPSSTAVFLTTTATPLL